MEGDAPVRNDDINQHRGSGGPEYGFLLILVGRLRRRSRIRLRLGRYRQAANKQNCHKPGNVHWG